MRYGSPAFSGRMAETTRRYVTLRPLGTADTEMKVIVFVPLTSRKPWAKHPISSQLDPCQMRPSRHWLSLRYTAILPVSGLIAWPCHAKWRRRRALDSLAKGDCGAHTPWKRSA